MSPYQQALAGHLERVARLARDVDPRFTANHELRAYLADGAPLPRIVLVGDNPGAAEFEHKEYLSRHGRSGGMARRFFDSALDVADSFANGVVVLNKSSLHTARTHQLGELMRQDPALQAHVAQDQADNARLLLVLQQALHVPVLTIGNESDPTIFRAFRAALDNPTAGALWPTAAGPRAVTPAFRKVPHFSHSQIFRKNANAAWNARLDLYAATWAQAVPGLVTDKDNLSSKAILAAGGPACAAYLATILLGLD